jgi:RNA recognition motif-containing protein
VNRDLQVVFGLHCEVHSVVMMKGFCFVNTASVEGATKALHALQGSRILGNEVKVNYAKDK